MRFLNHFLSVTFIAFGLNFTYSQNTNTDLLQYVDPMIGTDDKGHCFPGATTPLGMIQLSPSNDDQAKKHCSGYHYSDKTIKGFAHNHFSGTGLAGMGDLMMMPLSGKLVLEPGTDENPDAGYRSRISHKKEKASPGYYFVDLLDNDVEAELTASPRVGFHRYTYKKAGEHHVIIDPAHRIRGRVYDSGMEIISDTELIGFKHMWSLSCGERTVYFHIKFTKPFSTSGVFDNAKILEGQSKVTSKKAGAFVTFKGKSGEVVEATAAISYVDAEGAKLNHDSEASQGFNKTHQKARAMWAEKINKIKIEGTKAQKRILYTGMYHSFIAPNIISDVNGNYILEGKKLNSPNLVQLSNISTWDTYRALHPLWSIIDQKSNAHVVNVLASRYTQSNVGLSLWEGLGHDNRCMPGYDGISIMADAAIKELPNVNAQEIYQCIRRAANTDDGASPHYGKDNGVDDYIRLGGYIPASVPCSVSKTTENNYYDWCVAELADKLNYNIDESYYRERSLGYRNLFNPEKNYLWPRKENGDFIEMDLTEWGTRTTGLKGSYISGNIWSYTAYTPHDMEGAIELFGGKENYATWLDKMFTQEVNIKGEQHFDISGFIGSYGHGDEPGHQMPYSYMFVDQPWKTQELVNQIMTTFYFDSPVGYINNEDCGQMSAWYIFSSMGFYPVCPGDQKYYLGAPLHPKTSLVLENGKTFTVEAKNRTSKNIYVQSVSLNGKPLKTPYINHSDIMNGGTLTFEMTSKPKM